MHTPAGEQIVPGRVRSVDVFRGLTLLTMVFVNDVAELRDIPWWMRHAPTGADCMTFVDLVFPAFLFIVGMSIPLALGRRAAEREAAWKTAAHIATRTLGLLVIGVFMVNMPRYDALAAGMSKGMWVLLVFLGVILVWNRYPRSPGAAGWLFRTLRLLGIVALVWLAVVYRGRPSAGTTWMRTEWWGILGLIGWAYLTTAIAYVTMRRQLAAMVGALGLFIAMRIGDQVGAFGRLGDLLGIPGVMTTVKDYVWIGGHIGGHAAVTAAGAITAMLFLDGSPARTPRHRAVWIIVLAAGLFAAGFLLRPLYHISKIDATPTWCLYSAGCCCLIYLALYWLVDLRRRVAWAAVLRPAGANPLLAYILPEMAEAVLAILGVEYLRTHWNVGLAGIIRSLLIALGIVGLTGLLGRIGVRLRL